MPAIFSPAIAWVIKHEGGYVENPHDPGGRTKYGISQKSYPNLDIKNLTLMEAQNIYERDFWKPSLAYLLNDQRLATKYLDMCVNLYVVQGAKTLQMMLNFFQPNVCPINGQPSAAMMDAANTMAAKRGSMIMLGALGAFHLARYQQIIAARPDKAVFAWGWAGRALDIPPS